MPDDKACADSLESTEQSVEPAVFPSLTRRVVTFVSALTHHVHDGMTRCAEFEIEERLAVCHCCPSFTGAHCRECGCACNSTAMFFNKLAWKSEKCPLEKW